MSTWSPVGGAAYYDISWRLEVDCTVQMGSEIADLTNTGAKEA